MLHDSFIASGNFCSDTYFVFYGSLGTHFQPKFYTYVSFSAHLKFHSANNTWVLDLSKQGRYRRAVYLITNRNFHAGMWQI